MTPEDKLAAELNSKAVVQTDFVQARQDGGRLLLGNAAQMLQACGFDANALRPYWARDKRGNWHPYRTMMVNGSRVIRLTGNATLRTDEWKLMDDVLLQVAQE